MDTGASQGVTIVTIGTVAGAAIVVQEVSGNAPEANVSGIVAICAVEAVEGSADSTQDHEV